MHTIPLPPPLPPQFRGDLLVAAFHLPLAIGEEYAFRALVITLPSQLTEAAEVQTIGAKKDDKYWTPIEEHGLYTGEDALTLAWCTFQDVMAQTPGLPLKW